MSGRLLILVFAILVPALAFADEVITARTIELTEWKAVFGRIEARDRIPARSRLGGTLLELNVVEGSFVTPGQAVARVVDEKLTLQLRAVDATLASLASRLENALAELERGESLLQRGVTTLQRLDALRTEVEVIQGQIGATEAERSVLEQREVEGAVLAPIEGTVLSVPVSAGSVVLPGEVIAVIGGGGFFLRLAVPERHALQLEEGAAIRIESAEGESVGRLVKTYPQIENGRVVADVEVEGLATDFVDARVLVRLPVGTSEAVVVPADLIETRSGLDFVAVVTADGTPVSRVVVLGGSHIVDGNPVVEILSGLKGGETLAAGHE